MTARRVTSRGGARSVPRMLVMTACIAMYTTAVTHYFLTIRWLLLDSGTSTDRAKKSVDCVYNLFQGIDDPEPCDGPREDNVQSSSNDCVLSILLLINVRFLWAPLISEF